MKILQFLKVLFVAGPIVVYYHLRYIIKFSKHPEKYPIELRYATLRKEIIKVLKILHVKYDAKNYELISELKEKSLIISNHLSEIDPMIYIALSEKPITFVAKKETFNMPFAGKAAKAIDVFPLDRENLMNQIKQIKDVVRYLKDKTKPSVLIFIEGTRNRKPENPCLDFHPGTLRIAQMAECPLIVSAIYGTFRVLDLKDYLRFYPTNIHCIKTIPLEEVKEMQTTDYAPELKKVVDKEVDELRRIDKKFILESKNTKLRKDLETRVDARIDS